MSSADATTDAGPLAGLRVIDLTRVLSGPFCTMTLGDMGAEVIRSSIPRAVMTPAPSHRPIRAISRPIFCP